VKIFAAKEPSFHTPQINPSDKLKKKFTGNGMKLALQHGSAEAEVNAAHR
jgi:hypothetical protein